MKRLLIVIIVLMLPLCVGAEDLSAMSTEDLLALRLAVNNELAGRIESAEAPEGSTIGDLFPDVWIARHIRDELGKLSTGETVTQEELDTITEIYISGQTSDRIQVSSLEGLQYLHGLKRIDIIQQDGISEIPEWIGTLQDLIFVRFYLCPVTSVPDSICDLSNLRTLILAHTKITDLPDDIGNLTSLTNLSIAHTQITKLPSSIYNLTLDKFDREGLDID